MDNVMITEYNYNGKPKYLKTPNLLSRFFKLIALYYCFSLFALGM